MDDENTTPEDRIGLTPLVGEDYYGGCWYFVRGSKVHVHLSLSAVPGNESSQIIKLENHYPKINGFFPVSFANLRSVGMVHVSTSGYITCLTPDGYIIGDFEYYWR